MKWRRVPAKQNVVILKKTNPFFGHVLRRLCEQRKLKEPRVFPALFRAGENMVLLFTRARAYKARDEVGQNAVEQSKVDQNIYFLNLCLETPVRKVL